MNFDRYKPEVVTEEIDGITYTSAKFHAIQGLRLLGRVIAAIGDQGLRVLFGVRGNPGVNPADIMAALGPQAVVRMAAGLDADPTLAVDLLERTKANKLRPAGQGDVAPAFDRHFAGEYQHLFQTLAFVVAHNFLGPTLGSRSSGSPTSDETTVAMS